VSEPGPIFHLRPFQAEDQAPVKALILDGLGDHFPVLDETLNSDLDDIAASYLARGHRFIVAEVDGALVGAGALKVLDRQRGRLVRLSVAKDYRRRGFGQAMVEHLVTLARIQGLAELLVETNHDWRDAITLCRRCGFRPYARDETSIHMARGL